MAQPHAWKSRWLRSAVVVALVAGASVAVGGNPATAAGAGGGGGGGGDGGGGRDSGGGGGRDSGGFGGSNSGWRVDNSTTQASEVVRQINAAAAHAAGLDGRGVGVALIDTGVVPVPGLPAAQLANGPDLSFESQSPSLNYLDGYGHGTHLAGIIVGDDRVAGYRGIAPRAKLTSVKVATGTGSADVSQVIAAIDWVVEHRDDDPANRIRVINLAYGTDSLQDYRTDPLTHAVENAWRAGIVVVAAGGNTGAAAKRLTAPANDPFVLSVGSVGHQGTLSKQDDKPSDFSASSDGRRVDVLAPGESIVSLRNPGSTIDNAYPTARIGETLFKGSGTSQAAAVVSGAVALLLQYRPTLTPDQVKKLLVDTATVVPGKGNGKQGVGAIDLGSSLARTVPAVRQNFAPATGTGSLEEARGGSHVLDNGVELKGEKTIFGPFDTAAWAKASSTGDSWRGGAWMGTPMTGTGWTGVSWASRTYRTTTWTGQTWAEKAWTDTDWNGRYWSGRYWSGRYWSADAWSGRYWSKSSWSGVNPSGKSTISP